LGFNQEKYAIVASGFSGRHLFSTAKKLIQLLKQLDCNEIVNYPTVRGTKSDSWLLVVVKDV
jgi:ribosomal silencing factor RsfS